MANTTHSYPLRQGSDDASTDVTNVVGAKVLNLTNTATSARFTSPPNCRILRATAFVKTAVSANTHVQIGNITSGSAYGTVATSAVGTYNLALVAGAIGSINDTIIASFGGTNPTQADVDVIVEVIASSAV